MFALACFLWAVPAHSGILVLRKAGSLQFVDAISVTVNGKDKALSMGDQPKASAPFSKLPAVRLGGTLLRDSDSGVLAQYEPGKAEYLMPEGLPKNASGGPAEIWKETRVSYKKSASEKAGTEVATAEFVAFLPGGRGNSPGSARISTPWR